MDGREEDQSRSGRETRGRRALCVVMFNGG